MDEIPKEFQEPLNFTPIEESSKFSHVDVPDVFIDSNGKLFHGAPGGPHCRELTVHPLCCFIKSKLCSGDSSIVIKERLQEGSYSKLNISYMNHMIWYMTCDLMSWHYIIDISIKEVEHSEKIHESSTIFDPDELKLKIIFKVEFHTQHTLRRLAWSNSGIVNDSNTTFDFIIEKMNQVSCPIWAHLVNLTLQINAL